MLQSAYISNFAYGDSITVWSTFFLNCKTCVLQFTHHARFFMCQTKAISNSFLGGLSPSNVRIRCDLHITNFGSTHFPKNEIYRPSHAAGRRSSVEYDVCGILCVGWLVVAGGFFLRTFCVDFEEPRQKILSPFVCPTLLGTLAALWNLVNC